MHVFYDLPCFYHTIVTNIVMYNSILEILSTRQESVTGLCARIKQKRRLKNVKYTALLRGINVGGKNKVEMKRLKDIFASLDCSNVSTYINSGNVFFESDQIRDRLHEKIMDSLSNEYGFQIPLLIKTHQEIRRIADAIPLNWKNDSEQKTDVAFLFPEIDFEETADRLPVKKEFIDLKYVEGAIIWNVKREFLNKSQLTKIIGNPLYQSMTVRNVNTARFLADNM